MWYPLFALYDPLLRVSCDRQLEPALATNWEAVDETRYRYKLRKDVTFHSGNSFDAEGVKTSIERYLELGVAVRAYTLLNMIESVDDNKRREMGQELHPILAEDLATVPLFHMKLHVVMQSGVQGFEKHPLEHYWVADGRVENESRLLPGTKRWNASTALMPPKPKLLLRIRSTRRSSPFPAM